MKTIEEILANYKDYETFLGDRFGRRFSDFLTEEQAAGIGWHAAEGHEWPEPKEWTEENVLAQLKKDVEFGWSKACDERGISSELMYDVCKAWSSPLQAEVVGTRPGQPCGLRADMAGTFLRLGMREMGSTDTWELFGVSLEEVG